MNELGDQTSHNLSGLESAQEDKLEFAKGCFYPFLMSALTWLIIMMISRRIFS